MLKPKNVIDREDKGEIVEAEGGGTYDESILYSNRACGRQRKENGNKSS